MPEISQRYIPTIAHTLTSSHTHSHTPTPSHPHNSTLFSLTHPHTLTPHNSTLFSLTHPPPLTPSHPHPLTVKPLQYNIACRMNMWANISFYLSLIINLLVVLCYPFDKGASSLGKGAGSGQWLLCTTQSLSTCKYKTLTTPKLKELQRSKSRCKQLLLATTTTPNFVVFRCMVPKKWHENVPHTSVWGDGLQKCPIFMTVRQKRLNKVYHFKVNEKRNSMALVSVA